jgi:hypothetical protein
MRLRFDEQDAERAWNDWGCNCGPAALAAALNMTLDDVRTHMGPFEQRGYTNVTNMRESIASAGGRITRTFTNWPPVGTGLVRIQWGGPWIIDGKPARWAARASHWVATYRNPQSYLFVFDINGGLRHVDSWEAEIVPLIIQSIKRADGKWSISHSFGVTVDAHAAMAAKGAGE